VLADEQAGLPEETTAMSWPPANIGEPLSRSQAVACDASLAAVLNQDGVTPERVAQPVRAWPEPERRFPPMLTSFT